MSKPEKNTLSPELKQYLADKGLELVCPSRAAYRAYSKAQRDSFAALNPHAEVDAEGKKSFPFIAETLPYFDAQEEAEEAFIQEAFPNLDRDKMPANLFAELVNVLRDKASGASRGN